MHPELKAEKLDFSGLSYDSSSDTLRFADLLWVVSRADGEIEALENSVACPVVLEQAPPLSLTIQRV